ncbi:MAG: hypothetical protein ACE5LU_16435 [Anaerolineae bacterium]
MNSSTEAYIAIHNAFNPFEPIPPDKLDAWFVERPQGPLEALLNDLHPEKVPKRVILVGHPSSGKSTELTKLAAELADRFDYFVVRINLEQNLDIDRVNPVEVIFLMGAAIHKVAQAELKEEPDPEPLKAMKQGLETIVQTHTANKGYEVDLADLLGNLVCFGAGFIGGPGVGKATEAVIKRVVPPFRFSSGTDVEVIRKTEVEPQVDKMVDGLNALIDDVEAKAEKRLVLIADGLDKPRDPDVIALNFADKKFLVDPACRVVYAAPMLVYYAPRFAGVRTRFPVLEFPNVKLHERDDPEQRDEEGYETMRQVVHRRLRWLALEPNQVITPQALDLLIGSSGGVMRDLVRLVQDAAGKAEVAGKGHIDESIAAKAVSTLRRQFEAQLDPRYRRVLEEVRRTHQRTEHKECDELLQGNFVLSYVDGDVWFDVHSILWRGE